jgi:hypothetical protein
MPCLIVTTRQQQFSFIRLSDPHLRKLLSRFPSMLTTTTLYGSRLKWFEACP